MRTTVRHILLVLLLSCYFLTGVLGSVVVLEFIAKKPTTIERQKPTKTPQRTAFWTQHKHIPTTIKTVPFLHAHLLNEPTTEPDYSSWTLVTISFTLIQEQTYLTSISRAPPVPIL